VCGHGWPNIAGAWEKRRYVDLGHVLYHFYLIFFYKLFIFFIKKKRKRTMHCSVLLLIFFILKYQKKTPQNLSKPHIELKTKTQLNKKKTKTRLFFFHTYLWKKMININLLIQRNRRYKVWPFQLPELCPPTIFRHSPFYNDFICPLLIPRRPNHHDSFFLKIKK
jgi:hypothetical protein